MNIQHPAKPQTNDPVAKVDEQLEAEIATEKPTPEIPNFLANATKVDWVLFGALMAMTIYGLALIPFRGVLLLRYTFLNIFLTGGSFSVLSLGAQNSTNYSFLAIVVIVAALSMIKFLPIWYFLGARWGYEFVESSFGNKPPLWFRKLGNLVEKRSILCLFLAFIPFSPIPSTFVFVFAGIRKVKLWVMMMCAFIFALTLKLFFVYLGIVFGAEVIVTLRMIDKYIMYITFALLIWMFISIWKQNQTMQKK